MDTPSPTENTPQVLWDLLVDNLSIGLYVKDVDDDLRYVRCNRCFAAYHKRLPQEFYGRRSEEMFAPELASSCRRESLQTSREGVRRHFREEMMDAHGCWRSFSTVEIPWTVSGRRYVLGIVEDITDRKIDELKTDVVAYLNECDDFGRSCDYVAGRMLDVMRGDRVVLLPDPANAGWTRREWESPGIRSIGTDCGACPLRYLCREAFERGEHVQVFDDAEGAARGVRPRCGATSIIVANLSVHGHFWGTLALHSIHRRRHFGTASREMMETLAHVMSLALERSEAAWDLIAERDRALSAEKAKSFFFSCMSHNIRTPLNAIVGFSELLQKELSDNVESAKKLEQIVSSGQLLLQLVDDILDFASLDSDRMELIAAPVDFHSLAGDVLEMISRSQAKDGVRFIQDIPKNLPRLTLDALRIRQILVNLLENAAKFTPRGEVALSASFSVGAGMTVGTLRFAVSDTGIGIAAQDIAALTQPFVRISSKTQTGGTGLGLSICNSLVAKMGGTMKIESELGKGSRFTVTIPGVPYDFAPRRVEMPPPSQIAPTEKVGSEPSLLLVDDCHLNLTVLSSMCTRLGVKDLALASSGTEALEKLQEHTYDAVITDVWMPNMTGCELATAIHELPHEPPIPVYALTADVAMRHNEDDPFTDVLYKPIRLDRLRALLGTLAVLRAVK